MPDIGRNPLSRPCSDIALCNHSNIAAVGLKGGHEWVMCIIGLHLAAHNPLWCGMIACDICINMYW